MGISNHTSAAYVIRIAPVGSITVDFVPSLIWRLPTHLVLSTWVLKRINSPIHCGSLLIVVDLSTNPIYKTRSISTMSMTLLQRSLLFTTTASAPSFAVSSPPSSASPLRSFRFMLQFRALQNSPRPHSTLGFGNSVKCQKSSRIKFGKPLVTITINRTNIGQSFCPFNGTSDGSRCAVVTAFARCGFCRSLAPPNNFCFPYIEKGITRSLTNDGIFPKRYFSKARIVANKSDTVNTPDGKHGKSTFGFTSSNKHKKRAKAFIVYGKDRDVTSSTSASKDVDMVASRKKLEDKGLATSTLHVNNNKQDSKLTVRKKKKSESKNSKNSSSNSSEEAAGAQGSINSSKASTSNISDTNQNSSDILKKNSAKVASEELPDKSAPKKNLLKNQSGNSSKKGRSVKAANESKPEVISKVKVPEIITVKQLYPPTGKSVVIVESVTKAKVIQSYLGNMYEVLPSYGHVRDLAARSGSVRPDDDFSMVWEVPAPAWTHLKSIKVALSGAENLILASDPDREGEAIAWHIIEMLEQQDALHENISVARVVFHEITEQSIKGALQSPRTIDVNLVHSYLARRALDYLIGFNISPLLWRKLPGCQSAGRVQSAALSLICDREMEIDEFKPQEYWTVVARLKNKQLKSNEEHTFLAHLTHFDFRKLNQFSISSDKEAADVENKIISAEFQVTNVSRNKIRRNPPTPYITSTLQQDAANKLHFSASNTMRLAQKLYEGVELSDGKAVGLITYTRTDGLHVAISDIRSLIIERYGQNFASQTPRKYFKKVKNAQEAHEAIRPTDIRRLPSMLVGVLEEESMKLYTLIWSRTVACQMEPATFEQIQLDIGNADESIMFRSASSRIDFPGYQAVFKAERVQDKENNGSDRDETFGVLNALKARDPLHLVQTELEQHHTQPPPRYSEASLVKKLEELGIGRPSTYASTLKVLKDRNYVTVKSRVLYPEFRGRMVSAFLGHHFSEVTDYSFTADMETELDNVSAGFTEWKGLLRDYWTRFKSYCDRTNNVHIHQVEKMLEKKFGHHLFSCLPDQSRTCPSCMEGTLIFKVSRFGSGYFIGCDQHPRYIAKTLYGEEDEEVTDQNSKITEEPKILGVNPGSNEKVLLKTGPYGNYVQLGEDKKGYIPKRASVSHGFISGLEEWNYSVLGIDEVMTHEGEKNTYLVSGDDGLYGSFQIKDANSVTLEDALELLRYPLTLGKHPKDGQPVILRLSKVGFSVRHRRTNASVPKNVKPNDVTLEKALEYLSSNDVRQSGRPKSKPKVEEAVEAF
ncbi:DNA topoisomerase 1 [Senna tora]|uniref:DNA topoisomerase n=1 Tax=Senna tora TaxID=362788 RepID=A0A834TX15_9FABA|nr:DNA topoisomerase 1 [Senna tora]